LRPLSLFINFLPATKPEKTFPWVEKELFLFSRIHIDKYRIMKIKKEQVNICLRGRNFLILREV